MLIKIVQYDIFCGTERVIFLLARIPAWNMHNNRLFSLLDERTQEIS